MPEHQQLPVAADQLSNSNSNSSSSSNSIINTSIGNTDNSIIHDKENNNDSDKISTHNISAITSDHATRRQSQSTPSSASTTELARTKKSLIGALRSFSDFPIPGIDFVDILPLFANADLHRYLIRALELQTLQLNNGVKPDVIVGLDARGFLFGPSLALRLGASFAPVRKRGKLPGPTIEASFQKEYGVDHFQMQRDAIKEGQTVLVVDDIIATGGSAQAAGNLVQQLGGSLIGYLFILEIDILKGRDILRSPVVTLLADKEKE